MQTTLPVTLSFIIIIFQFEFLPLPLPYFLNGGHFLHSETLREREKVSNAFSCNTFSIQKICASNAMHSNKAGSSLSILVFFLQVLVNDKTKTNENQRSARDGAYVETHTHTHTRESQSVKKDEM